MAAEARKARAGVERSQCADWAEALPGAGFVCVTSILLARGGAGEGRARDSPSRRVCLGASDTLWELVSQRHRAAEGGFLSILVAG